METMKIKISEAGLKAVAAGNNGMVLTWVRNPILAQCDTCQTFVAQGEVGYRDERTECRDCHVCGWRCDGDWEEVVHPENVRETKEPAHSHQWGNYLHTASTLVRKPQDHHCKLCDCGKLLCEVQQ